MRLLVRISAAWAGFSCNLVAIAGGGAPPLLVAEVIPSYGSFTFGFVRDGTEMDVEEIDKTIDDAEHVLPTRSLSRAG